MEKFLLSVGLRQGAIFSPFLFNIFFGEIIRQMYEEFELQGLKGVEVRYENTTRVLKKGVKQSRTVGVSGFANIFDSIFADDLVLFAKSAEDLQKMIDIFNRIVMEFGQSISVSKTKVMIVQPSRIPSSGVGLEGEGDEVGEEGLGDEIEETSQIEFLDDERASVEYLENGGILLEVPEVFYVNGEALERVKKFKYLGSVETENARMDEEILVREQKMITAYNRYNKSFFRSALSRKIKVKVFNMVIVTNGLYGCQTWNATQNHIKKLEGVYFTLVRRLLNFKKYEWGRGEIIKFAERQGLKIYPLEWRMITLQLRYIGHQVRIGKCEKEGKIVTSLKAVGRSPHTLLVRGDVVGPKLKGGGG